jgi:hypothetical protein
VSDRPGWASPGGGAEPSPPPSWGPPPAPPSRSGSPATAPGGWSGWTGSPITKPGVIPLRPLGVGEILDGAITTIRRYPRATLGTAAVVVTVTQLLQFFLLRYLTVSPVEVSDAGAVGFDATGSGALMLAVTTGFVANVVLTGALTVIIGQAVLGRPIELAQTWHAVRTRLWALLGTAVLVLVLDAVALALLIVPFFFAWPALSLATPALMLERQPVGRAISRSVALVRGQFWLFGLYLVPLGAVMVGWDVFGGG